MQKKTKKILIIVSAVVLPIALLAGMFWSMFSVIFRAFPPYKPEDELLLSYDNRYTLSVTWTQKNKNSMAMSTAEVIDNDTDEIVFTVPESFRAWDFYGFYWSDNYDIWYISRDIGDAVYVYDDARWVECYIEKNGGADGMWKVVAYDIDKEFERPGKSVPKEILEMEWISNYDED